MIAREVGKWAGIAAAVAGTVKIPYVADLIDSLGLHEWAMLAVAVASGLAVVKAQIGLGQGDDPKSTSFKGILKPTTTPTPPGDMEKVDF